VAPQGYHGNSEHLVTWANSIRTRQPLVEAPIFGYRTAGEYTSQEEPQRNAKYAYRSATRAVPGSGLKNL
jgi:hypothetical protein